mgnify:CR=1 FL=1
MRVLRAMLQWIRRPPPQPPCGACPWAPPRDELREREAWLERALDRAGTANDRAALGFVATTGQAMKQESRIQAMLRGVLEEVDRDVDRG